MGWYMELNLQSMQEKFFRGQAQNENIKVCGVADYVIFLPILYDIILVMIIHL
jgi:hypothetical protein